MKWLGRWFGKRPVAAQPWSFPRRMSVVADSLAVTVFEHAVQSLAGTVSCWTFVTDGLIGFGQKELVLTIAQAPGEHPEHIAAELGRLLAMIRQLAAGGRRVDVGDITTFNGPRPGGARGLSYVEPQRMDGVELPVSALAVIPLMGAEAEVAQRFGVLRVMGRLAAHYRQYPCPPWWVRGRTAVAAAMGDDSSLLERLPLARVPGLSARTDPERGILLCVHPSAQERFLQTLTAAPSGAAFALLPDLDTGADGLLVWTPGVKGLAAATPPGSRGSRPSLCFVGFALGVDDISTALIEDGALVSCTAGAWDALLEAVRAGEPLTLAPTAGDRGLALDWVMTTYVSPVDGRAFAGDAAWRTFSPETPGRRRVLEGVVLLTPDGDLLNRVSVEALAGYLDRLERVFKEQYGERSARTTIHVRVELRPGEPAWVAGSGDLDQARIAALVASVPPPIVTHGPVVFECSLSTHPDRG